MSEYLTRSPGPASTPRAPQTRPAGYRRAMPGYPRSHQGPGVRYPHPGPAAGVLWLPGVAAQAVQPVPVGSGDLDRGRLLRHNELWIVIRNKSVSMDGGVRHTRPRFTLSCGINSLRRALPGGRRVSPGLRDLQHVRPCCRRGTLREGRASRDIALQGFPAPRSSGREDRVLHRRYPEAVALPATGGEPEAGEREHRDGVGEARRL